MPAVLTPGLGSPRAFSSQLLPFYPTSPLPSLCSCLPASRGSLLPLRVPEVMLCAFLYLPGSPAAVAMAWVPDPPCAVRVDLVFLIRPSGDWHRFFLFLGCCARAWCPSLVPEPGARASPTPHSLVRRHQAPILRFLRNLVCARLPFPASPSSPAVSLVLMTGLSSWEQCPTPPVPSLPSPASRSSAFFLEAPQPASGHRSLWVKSTTACSDVPEPSVELRCWHPLRPPLASLGYHQVPPSSCSLFILSLPSEVPG